MKPILENNVLSTDLDCRFFDLLNVSELIPVPPGLVSSTDPRLTDARVPLPGSVVDASVAAGAGIVQSKLNLNGQIPAAWLGTTATTAAQGNLAEYISRKAQANGYASLDGSAKVPNAQLPNAFGTGTVTSVGLSMPAQFTVTGSPVTGSGTLSAAWNAATPDLSWFGNNSGGPGAPQFYTTPLPLSLIPQLDAAIVTSGVINAARLPVAVGIGGSHAPGAVPDPGSGAIDGLPTDYLARDMTYKPEPSLGPAYQPVVPNPVLTVSSGPPFIVTIVSLLPGVDLFFSIDSTTTGFTPIASGGTVSIGPGQYVAAYGSRNGYTNSGIEVMPAPGAPPGEVVVTGDPANPTEVVLGDDSLAVTVGP